MTFGIEKCATMVIKPMNFQSPPNYSDPTIYLGMNAIPKVSSYIYLGIPFLDDLLFEHIYLTCILKIENPFFHLRVSFQIN